MSDHPQQITINFHGVVFRLECDHLAFFAFVQDFLQGLFPLSHGEPDILVRFSWETKAPQSWEKATQQWGRRLLQDGSKILLKEVHMPGLMIAAEWQGPRLVLDAYYQPASLLHRLAQLFKRGMVFLYHGIFYYLFYFPIIYYLQQRRGWNVLHVAAVETEHGACLIAGLPGSGKTTLSLGLLARPGVKLLSDNLLFYDSGTVYACPEPLHLNPNSHKLLASEVLQQVQDTGKRFSYNRRDFRLQAGMRTLQARPRLLLFVGQSQRPALNPVDPETALARVSGFNRMAREVVVSEEFSAGLHFISPTPATPAAAHQQLADLLGGMDCYEVWLEKGAPISGMAGRIFELLAASEAELQAA